MALYYLDTSALVKRYRTERGTEVMAALFSDQTLDDAFITSHLTVLEVEAVAARALGARLLTQRAYESLYDIIQRMTVIVRPWSVIEEAPTWPSGATRAI